MAWIRARKRADGTTVFAVGFRVDGRAQWSPTIAEPETAAWLKSQVERLGHEAALAVFELRSADQAQAAVPTLSEWLEEHLTLVGAHVEPGTVAGYRREAARTWLPRLGELPLPAVTEKAVSEWLAWQRRQETERSRRARTRAVADGLPEPGVKTVSPKTIANAHGLLSSVLSSAAKRGHIASNPAHGMRLPTGSADEKEILTREEWNRLRGALDVFWVPLTTFLLVTGARFGEATALQVRDLDIAGPHPSVRIRRAWKKGEAGVVLGPPKSRRSTRAILVGHDVAALLATTAEGKGPEDLVFTSREGRRVQAQHYIGRVWRPAVVRAGIAKHVTPHSLRHTSASWLLMEGVPPQVVQHRLGHESLATTSRVYAHLLTDAQAPAAALLDAAVGKL